MTEGLDRGHQPPGGGERADAGGTATTPAPTCFVVDDEASIRSFLSLILHGSGIDTQEFADGASFRQAIERQSPDLVFLDVGLDFAVAVESVVALGKRGYFGFVQLMSNRGSAVLEHVKTVGEQHGLQMLPGLKKPFDTAAIQAIVQQLKLGHAASQAARIALSEALNEWMDRILASAEDRPAQEAARRRRDLRALPAPAERSPAAGRIHAWGDRIRIFWRCRSSRSRAS